MKKRKKENLKFSANNVIILEGTVETEFKYDHYFENQWFYVFTIASRRPSGTSDYIQCSVNKSVIGKKQNLIGKKVRIIGKFNSYGDYINGKRRKLYQVVVLSLEIIPEKEVDENKIILLGKVLNTSKVKTTSSGRNVENIQVSIRNNSGKNNSFPVVIWKDLVEDDRKIKPEMHIKIVGRIEAKKGTILDSKGNLINFYKVVTKKVDFIKKFE